MKQLSATSLDTILLNSHRPSRWTTTPRDPTSTEPWWISPIFSLLSMVMIYYKQSQFKLWTRVVRKTNYGLTLSVSTPIPDNRPHRDKGIRIRGSLYVLARRFRSGRPIIIYLVPIHSKNINISKRASRTSPKQSVNWWRVRKCSNKQQGRPFKLLLSSLGNSILNLPSGRVSIPKRKSLSGITALNAWKSWLRSTVIRPLSTPFRVPVGLQPYPARKGCTLSIGLILWLLSCYSAKIRFTWQLPSWMRIWRRLAMSIRNCRY